MEGLTTAFWGMTINNYDETDLAMVHSGYPDYMREFVHTLEVGENGTPHVQAWIKLQRQQRLSFVRKLFPRGHFKALTSDEYKHNTKSYAQKLDGTAASPAMHTFNDPMNTIESVVKKVMLGIVSQCTYSDASPKLRKDVERDMVVADYKFAKIFVSATYNQMWKQFGIEMLQCVINEHTHTHTHTENLISREGSINNAASEDDATQGEYDAEEGSGDYEDEDHEVSGGSADEGYDSSSSVQTCSTDAR